MRLGVTQYARALLAAYSSASVKERKGLIKRFLLRLTRERRARWLEAILRSLENLKAQNQLNVRSAHALKSNVRNQIEVAFRGEIGDAKIEPGLLGGLIVETKDLRLNASLQGKIRELTKVIS